MWVLRFSTRRGRETLSVALIRAPARANDGPGDARKATARIVPALCARYSKPSWLSDVELLEKRSRESTPTRCATNQPVRDVLDAAIAYGGKVEEAERLAARGLLLGPGEGYASGGAVAWKRNRRR